MTSSISTRSTLSGLSEGCLSEAGSSGLQKRTSREESQEDCPKCAAMRLNTVIAEEALASLSGQFKNLQKELKKTEQVSKINEEQAKYIDERRSKLEKLEAEHTSLYAEYENLRINHDSLKRQYDEVVATARRNQRLIEESAKYHETCKVAMENLMAEKEARQELLAKYLKSVEAAAKINDSMKHLEKKCIQLQATNEKLEPFKQHSPAMLRLLLEFGEIIENNGLMTKSLQKRFARYKDKEDLCEYLLRKTRRITNLSESSTKTIEESSDDEELAKGVEDLLLTIGSPPRLKSPKKSISSKEEMKNTEKSNNHPTNPSKEMGIGAVEKGNFLKKKLENVKASHVSDPKVQCTSNLHIEKTKSSLKMQLELTEKQKKKILNTNVDEEKVVFPDVMDACTPSTSSFSLAEENEKMKENHVQQSENELQQNIRTRYGNISKLVVEKDERNAEQVERELRISDEKQVCRNTERLSTWLSFVRLDPLLPELGRPTFLDNETADLSKQHGSDDYMDILFGAISPSISSRRTSVSSTESCVISKNTARSRPETNHDVVLTSKETNFLDEPLSLPPVPAGSTYSAVVDNAISTSTDESGSLCPVSGSTLETVTIIHDEQTVSKLAQNLTNTINEDSINEILVMEEQVVTVKQTSQCVRTSSSQRKRSTSNAQNEDESLGTRFGHPKLPKVIIAESTDTKKDRLEENQDCRTQRSEIGDGFSERAIFSNKRCSEKEENFVKLPDTEVGNVLEMLEIKNAELKAIKNEEKLKSCTNDPILQKEPLRQSARRKLVRCDSSSSEDNHELVIDAEELISGQSDRETEVLSMQQENMDTKSDEAKGNWIPVDGSMTLHEFSETEAWNSTFPCGMLNERKLEDNSMKHEIPNSRKLENQVEKAKQNHIHSSTTHVGREIALKNQQESSINNVQIVKSRKSDRTRNDKQKIDEAVKQKHTQEVSSMREKRGNVDQSTVSSQKSKMVGTHHEKKLVSEDSEDAHSSTISNIKSMGMELSDLDDVDNRLEIVTDDIKAPSLNVEGASDVIHVSNTCDGSEKAEAKAGPTRKSASTVKSEMYKKMRKRLAVQTSCLKELVRVQVRKPPEKKIIYTLPTSKKTEGPSTSQRKKAAVMLHAGRNGSKKDVGLSAHGTIRLGISATKVLVGSDEAAVMCIFDQALSESNYTDKLVEIIQKFQTPAISTISCEKLAEFCVKFINKLDVGNMWHSVVLAVRYWTGKQRDRCTINEVLDLHQVASSKERNFIEVLHQLSGEEHWNDVILFFLRKMVISVIKTRLVSIAQHGLNIRCVLLCSRIVLQHGSNNEIMEQVTNLLHRLIERDSSDKVVPMMCYSVAIVPEIVDKLLLDENEEYEPVRRVMSVHLASRDEFFTIFNKVIMSRLLNKDKYSATCMQKLSSDDFLCWFTESINSVVTDISGLNLDSLEMSARLSSTMMTCYALFSLATNRLVSDKETLVLPVLNECVQIISDHFENEEKERNVMFADTTALRPLSDDMLIKTILRLLLFGRLITSFVKSTECCVFPQVAILVEEIHRLREYAKLKLEQGNVTVENRLIYFGLNDWLRIVKPCTNYLRTAFTVAGSD